MCINGKVTYHRKTLCNFYTRAVEHMGISKFKLVLRERFLIQYDKSILNSTIKSFLQ